MEKLQREQDGHSRTSSGYVAVIPRTSSGLTAEGARYFEFKAGPLSAITRVEWPDGSPVALLDNEVALRMLSAKYAYDLTEEQVEEYNKAVDAMGDEPPPAPPQGEGTGSENQSSTPTNGGTFPPEGWQPHPTAAGFYYKDQEVLSEADLRAKIQ